MDPMLLAKSIAAGALFASPLALAYRWLKRHDRAAVANTWKVFVTLAAIIAARYYFLHLPP